jgi:hypothetical protein
MLNCIDKDGTNSGYDLALLADVKRTVRIPVIGAYIRPGSARDHQLTFGPSLERCRQGGALCRRLPRHRLRGCTGGGHLSPGRSADRGGQDSTARGGDSRAPCAVTQVRVKEPADE